MTARCSTFLFAPLLLAASNLTSCLCSFLRLHFSAFDGFSGKKNSICAAPDELPD
jgi:hypothetical protein